ncbi:endonuclease/exonuclease/phosphatase family protein [Chryseobacterium gambrini]|uniref:endonuclease/exonuclease/phosphatase family protein n=1 Tax=Chryseobacterium gambrini TaxID=373672 RepID=UPI0022F3B4FD|nr:endonuclease/exonuclease/phosphatase family protein [Chryseobacterium gambrini]WBX99694.1 endonuclease/exonuclease/phosphatase family protein [Chryseobacterium gambrini]
MKILRLIFLILHTGIFLLLSGMLMNAYVSPKIFPWLNLLSLGFPLLIIAYILLTIFWIISWKKRAFVFFFAGLLFFNPVLRWINFSQPKNEKADLKIVTFNVKNGVLGKENIENFINSQDADVVLFQEMVNKKYDFKDLKQSSKTLLTSVFTKHKVIAEKNLLDGEYENGNATQTDIEINGKTYRIINVYLQPFRFDKSMVKLNGDSEEDEQKLKDIVRKLIPTFKIHQEQIVPIRESIESSPYPVIVAGDFNAVPNSYEYYELSKDLEDAFMKAGSGSATSFHDYKFPIRIDYIFTSKSIKALSYKVDRSAKLSDHYPVVATFKLSN